MPDITCPRCGRAIPDSSPQGLCPFCVFHGAMGEDAPWDEASNPEETETRPMAHSPSDGGDTRPSDASRDLEGSGSTAFHIRPRPPGILRWVLIPPFLLLALYVGARLLYAQEHPRPSFGVLDNLTTIGEHTDYGVGDGHRIASVNGVPVSTPMEARTEMNATAAGAPVYMEFVPGNGTDETPVSAAFLRFPNTIYFDVSDVGTLTAESGDLPVYLLDRLDAIVAVNDVPVDDIARRNLTPAELTQTRRSAFELATETGILRVVVESFNFGALWARYFAAVAILALGLGVYWLKPGLKSSVGFLVFAATFGTLSLLRCIPIQYRFLPENLGLVALQLLLVVACVVFMVTFTPLRLVSKRWWIPVGAAAVVSLCLLVATVLSSHAQVMYGVLGRPVLLSWALILLMLIVITFVLDYLLRLRGIKLGNTDRNRATLIRFAVLLGFLPAIFAVIFSAYESGLVSVQIASELGVFLFPLLVGYAIVRHNLLQLNELAREGLLYGLLIALFIGMYAVGTGYLTPFVDDLVPGAKRWATPVLVSGTVLLAIPLHTQARKYMDRRFNRVPLEYESFAEALEEDALNAVTPLAYCQTVAEKLSRSTHTAQVTVLTHAPGVEPWRLAAMTPAPQINISVSECRTLLTVVERARAVVFREDLLEQLELAPERESALRAIRILRATAVFPLVARGRLLGAVTLGEKEDGTNFNAAELKTLRRIIRHVAVTLGSLMDRERALRGLRIVDLYPDFPDMIGPFHIDGVIGQGGMAYVYRGHTDVGREVAIKVAKHLVQANDKLMERFHREGRAMQRLNHPSIVQILDIGWEGSEPYIALEYLPGGSLAERVRGRGALSEAAAVNYVLQAIAGLQYALEQGVIHRDIKPRNLFFAQNGHIKVGDFGIARITDEETITSEGEIFGTPEYMAPELIHGLKASWLSDQYALGVTLFEMLVGRRPFVADNLDALIYQYLNKDFPDIRQFRRELSADIAKTIRRMVAKQASKRFQSYAEVRQALLRANARSVVS